MDINHRPITDTIRHMETNRDYSIPHKRVRNPVDNSVDIQWITQVVSHPMKNLS
jgi:hypothetical protein